MWIGGCGTAINELYFVDANQCRKLSDPMDAGLKESAYYNTLGSLEHHSLQRQ